MTGTIRWRWWPCSSGCPTSTADWSFRRADAYAHLVRLRTALAPRLPASALRVVDDVLSQVVALSGADADDRVDAALDLLVSRLGDTQRRRRELAVRLDHTGGDPRDRDPRSGLYTEDYLRRWSANSATGTLSVGLVLIRVHELSAVRGRLGFRAELAVVQAVGRLLHAGIAAADRALRVGPQEFLLVLPARDSTYLAAHAEILTARIAELAQHYPYVTTPTTIAVTCTRRRPLPLTALWGALDHAVQTGEPLVTVPDGRD